MKFYLIYLTLLLPLIFIGCGDDDHSCICDVGTHKEGDQCVASTKTVTCTEPITKPENSSADLKSEEITWNESSWGTPSVCDWICKSGFYQEGSSCLAASKEVSCKTPFSVPDNSEIVQGDVTITYSNGHWSEAAECRWTCDENYHREDDRCEFNSKTVSCRDIAPENATSLSEDVTVLWVDNRWETQKNCDWSCDSGFTKEFDAYCVAQPIAGALNGICLDGGTCNGALDCRDDLCKEVKGFDGEPCYDGDRCELGLICSDGTCSTKSCGDCGSWGRCDAATALCIPNSNGCRDDKNCPYGTHCSDHSCVAGIKITTLGSITDDIHISGTFNDWSKEWTMVFDESAGRYEVILGDNTPLDPGEYGYKFFRYNNGSEDWWEDVENPYYIYNDGIRNSRLTIVDPKKPKMILLDQPEISKDGYRFVVQYIPGNGGEALDESHLRITLNGAAVTATYNSENRTFTIFAEDLDAGKYSYLFRVVDSSGNRARDLFVPIWIEEDHFQWYDAFLYQIMTDRFVNGSTANDQSANGDDEVKWKANWQGGDFQGIIAKLKDGYFQKMGINAIWISSPIINTQGSGVGSDGYYYSGYHSYWPIGTGWSDDHQLAGLDSAVEPHFGSEEELKELVQEAHKRGIRVVADFVANHVHTDALLWQNHVDEWFHRDGDNANGGYTCGWDRPVECWFTEYLPDFEYKNIYLMNFVLDHAIWMAQEFDLDGFRLDAVKHMVTEFSSTLRARVQEEIATTGIQFYMVGETFVGEDGYGDIEAYLGADKLDGQFDFPLFYRISNAFFLDNMSLKDLYNFAKYNDTRYQQTYDGALMSNFFGNHDISRAISVANGEFDGSPQGGGIAHDRAWINSPVVPISEIPFKRLMMAQTFLMTSPGIPLIYQGDEFGMPGAHDPDNRRIMIFGDVLSEHQQMALTHAQKLGRFRLKHPALRYGVRTEHWMDDTKLVYSMRYHDDVVIVVFNRNSSEQTIEDVNLSSVVTNAALKDRLSGKMLSVGDDGIANFTLGAYETAVFAVE